ncbi:MAG TPA: hypothetical protein PKY28_03175 [Ferruginibacter sp.]|nr:hypothetical protein [Chitinophagaceae bacterium]MBK7559184.1 hypothetical protein [Chitinophagaceae bacterium]MBK8494396.1 hypothetical protein [Chitinophagaceae bacterium]MBK9533268.1 hypothetical protein [Chitinophagaceae bacterium]HQW92068.1 hypothetical protein [Ferruginibacter sp.]
MNTGKKITQADEAGMDAEISAAERLLLDESLDNSVSVDNNNLRRSALDSVDADGDPVNENSFNLTGEDLDIPGSELDDEAEETGAEDEENNGYSRADTE